MASKSLARRHNYLSKTIEYLAKSKIREYDIKDAGFSLIKTFRLLDEKMIKRISKITNKFEKNVFIGKLIRKDPSLGRAMMDSFVLVRTEFFQDNDLNESSVIAIKKDAIITTKYCPVLKFYNDSILFVERNVFTSFYTFDRMEFYYDGMKNYLDIRGASRLVDRNNEFLVRLKEIFKSAEMTKNKKTSIALLASLREDYLRGKLEKESYRELKSGMFRVDINFGTDKVIRVKDIAKKEDINLGYNYTEVIVPLISLIL